MPPKKFNKKKVLKTLLKPFHKSTVIRIINRCKGNNLLLNLKNKSPYKAYEK